MPQMEVVVIDTTITVDRDVSDWVWQINWEYLSLTIIPISSNGEVQITDQWVGADAGNVRRVHYRVKKTTPGRCVCLATMTFPAQSVM